MSTFYEAVSKAVGYSDELQRCILRVAERLADESTTHLRPGMLLGRIQSGKTRAFIGVIARAFDLGFDICIVFTKGTRTLASQTVKRIERDLEPPIQDDRLLVFDIMNPPGRLTRAELARKIVIIAKKEANNLDRVLKLFRQHAGLAGRRLLIIDDEADLASVRFVKRKAEAKVQQGVIATKLDQVRRLAQSMSYLQVTATPYSLYLQPEDYKADSEGCVFEPKRPAFTELLPTYLGYFGGDDFFSRDETGAGAGSPLFVRVPDSELDALRKPDRRRIRPGQELTSPNTAILSRALMTFLTASAIRTDQDRSRGLRPKKYAMVIHCDTQKAAHSWQEHVVRSAIEQAEEAASTTPEILRPAFDVCIEDLSPSIRAAGGHPPDPGKTFSSLLTLLIGGEVSLEKVNSDTEVANLLDGRGELRLKTRCNIFVGGSILDRGITIPNLIAFYYGRNPKTTQADTALQHSRMYGSRPPEDVAVTRFYTSHTVYDRLYAIHRVERALRDSISKNPERRGAVFIQSGPAGRVRPCSPDKVRLSDLVAVPPGGFYLPTNFRTRSAEIVAEADKEITRLIPPGAKDSGRFGEIDRGTAIHILSAIERTLDLQESDFEWEAMRGLVDYYSTTAAKTGGGVAVLAETGRNLTRERSGDKSGLSILGERLRPIVRESCRKHAGLILLRQEGKKHQGWSGHPFWWPIFAVPVDASPCLFALRCAAEARASA